MSETLLALARIFTELSLLAFGGGNSILPEMQRQVVEVQHWMNARQFAALFALAQAAPGPNMMVVPLIGWHVAGVWGLLVSAVAKFLPSSLVTGLSLMAWERFRDRPWRRGVQIGLAPMTIGLVAASAAVMVEATLYRPVLAGIGLAGAALLVATRIHPLWVLLGGALIGLSGIGQG
ncbi:chromate transporter [Pseudoroseomonas cervicalis]|uniref:chromate transporter n=1 Tax=Teichococcus cervicalis TaxID=204525 RepID=UPI002781F826|nr:chromate transporter [Pseudoroseomonas cervicalis]MDQ1077956.1 chromate transporter [Pseudoroseomonas cervicalis]